MSLSKTSIFEIVDSIQDLEELSSKLYSIDKKTRKRVLMLLEFKKDSKIHSTRLAEKLDVNRKTIGRWRKEYCEVGIRKFVGEKYFEIIQCNNSTILLKKDNKKERSFIDGSFVRNTIGKEAEKMILRLEKESE